jgi:hypothetical protein
MGSLSLTERAVSIATGVRHEVRPAALLATVTMPTQSWGATSQQRIENAPMMFGQGWERAAQAGSQYFRQAQSCHRSRRTTTGHEMGGASGLG